jgi:hypothetical protein
MKPDPCAGTCEDRRLLQAGYIICGSNADQEWHWRAPNSRWHDGYRSESAAVNAALRNLVLSSDRREN